MTTTEDTTTRTSKVQRSLVEMTGGETFVVRVTNPDRLRWDMTAPRKGWGKAQDVPFMADTFVTWAAAKRQGDTELDWDAFQAQCVEITHLEQEEDDVLRPTNRGATDGL